MKNSVRSVLVALATGLVVFSANAADKKIVIVAGKPSHGVGEHEFRAGALFIKSCLDKFPGVQVSVYSNGWPTKMDGDKRVDDNSVFDGADAVMIFADGGGGNPAIQGNHLQVLSDLMKKGVSLGCYHYAVEIPKDKGGPEFTDWIGGYYEDRWSTNPHWDAEIKSLPAHPITRGVKPFHVVDEWYYNIRFRPDMKGVTPILVAKPSDETREGKSSSPRGPYPHVVAASGREEVLAWAVERPDGGRGFGFTGLHFHKNFGNDDFRKLVLNSLVWLAKMEVPADGVPSATPTADELKQNLDPKGQRRQAATPSRSGVSSANAKFKSGLVKGKTTVSVDADITGAKSLWLVVNDGGDGFGCDWADWIEPMLVKSDGSTVKLTDLKWESATAGHGAARVNKNVEGNALKINGKVIENGIGTHAVSMIGYALPEGNFTRFKASAGLDDGGTDQGCGSTVEFLVFTDKPSDASVAGGPRRPRSEQLPTHSSGIEAALADTKKLTAGTGLEATLFASEPMVVNPCDMDIDARGRVWINEGANYRLTMHTNWGVIRPGGDRISILEDTDGDGHADKQSTFYQDETINAALGICVLGNKVIVSSSPNVFVLTDTDGDGVADKRELLFQDTSRGDHDHCMHAFVFGPDGKLYFNHGNEVRELRRPKGGIMELPLHGKVPAHESETAVDLAGNEVKGNGKPYRMGMVFRCNLDGSELETLGWNFRNNYEVAVDSFGTLWQSDNDDDGNKGVRINYVMEFGNYGYADELTGANWGVGWKKAQEKGASESERPYYHWHQYDPGIVPNLLQTGNGSPTGIAVYEGKALPEIFRNQIVHCDAGPRVVRSYPVEKSGAGYTAKIENVLSGGDNWYRPSDVCVGPDGALYIADWNDAGVGGHNMADRILTNMTGRVYRVAPPGFKSSVPKLDLKTAAGCVAALQSPNQATRYLAWTELHKMGNAAKPELEKLWTQKEEPRMRARALHLLARIKGSEKKYVETALKDSDSDIRITGLRIARELKMNTIPYVKQLANDSSAQVRRECAIALRHSESSDAPKLWATLAAQHDGKDRWYLEALGIGADKQEGKCFAAWLNEVKNNWDTPAGHDIVWRTRSPKALPMLVKLITAKETAAPEKDHYMRALDFISGPEKEQALVEIATAGL